MSKSSGTTRGARPDRMGGTASTAPAAAPATETPNEAPEAEVSGLNMRYNAETGEFETGTPTMNAGNYEEMVYNPQTGEFEYTNPQRVADDFSRLATNRANNYLEYGTFRQQSRMVDPRVRVARSYMINELRSIADRAASLTSAEDVRAFRQWLDTKEANIREYINNKRSTLEHEFETTTSRRVESAVQNAMSNLSMMRFYTNRYINDIRNSAELRNMENNFARQSR